LLAALTGDEPHSSALIEAAIDLARTEGEGLVVDVGLLATAIIHNGLGRYELALPPSLQASEAPTFHLAAWALPELIEAAVRTANDAVAADALERLADITSLTDSDWVRGVFARCRALVSNVETAEEHYREAIECFSRTALRPEHGRSHLLYGEWLRRQNRRIDARHQLRRLRHVQ
jgi:hypothetical protein